MAGRPASAPGPPPRDDSPHAVPEDLGRACGAPAPGGAGAHLRRSPPGARGDLAAGVRGAAPHRAARPPSRPHDSHRGPQRADGRSPDADRGCGGRAPARGPAAERPRERRRALRPALAPPGGSEEHTSELQSLAYLVCRLLLEKKKRKPTETWN